jgi:hypothetical protein
VNTHHYEETRVKFHHGVVDVKILVKVVTLVAAEGGAAGPLARISFGDM